QDARLFTHLSVEGNLRFALKRAPASGQAVSYDQVLKVLDLAPLLDRNTLSLSGGERQRVALGRTLLSQPELLLLDEPMSALDVRRKGELLPFIERVPEAFNLPMIFVSHAVDEVVRLADEAIILHAGKVTGRGPLPDIFQGSEMAGLTGHFEAGAVVEAKVLRQDTAYQLTVMESGGQEVQMPMVSSLAAGDAVRLRIRARDVSVAIERPTGISTRNCLKATVSEVIAEPDTAFAEVVARMGDQAIRARITRQAADELDLSPGMDVLLLIKSVSFDRRVLISPKS
ncbi:MAG: TOBE domain-containing protein, partial [Pseudomonadota bacterium]